jgi:hypothetical protein
MPQHLFESVEAIPLEKDPAIVRVLLGCDLIRVWDGKFANLHPPSLKIDAPVDSTLVLSTESTHHL